MNVPENEVRVYYKHKDKIVEKLDLAIESTLSNFGLKRWASGFDCIDGIRDLAFQLKVEKES